MPKPTKVPFQALVVEILSYLQDPVDHKRAFSTIWLIFHVGFEGKTVGQHPFVCQFMKGAQRVLPLSKSVSFRGPAGVAGGPHQSSL